MFAYPEPDYTWWAKADSWSPEDAALLLHGVDPFSCRLLEISTTEIPLGLREVHKTCDLLKSISWKGKYPNHSGKRLHPLAVVREAIKKELPLPQSLRELILKHFASEDPVNKNTSLSEKS